MSQRRGPDDSAPPPGDGDLPGPPPEWSDVVVPDDLRELAAEAAAIRAELAREYRRERRWRLFQSGLSVPFIALVLLLAAAVSSLIVVVTPSGRRPPEAAPLATPGTETGKAGGLLPDVSLTDDRQHMVRARGIRPAVLLLMPPDCRCERVAAELVLTSRESLVHVGLVGVDALPGLPNGSTDARVQTFQDPGGVLARSLSTPGPAPTAVLVRADGVITRIASAIEHPRELRLDLAALAA